MKKISVHLIIFCTIFLPISSTQAADVDYFDFDGYEARMASMAEADRVDEEKINRLLAPLDVPLGNRGNLYNALDDNDVRLQEILAESVKTAQAEQVQRIERAQEAFNETREKAIQINQKIGELTGIVEENSKNSKAAFQLYLKFPSKDPEIEALENGEEKTRRLRKHQEAQVEITQTWLRLSNLHAGAKADLAKLETEEDTLNKQFLDLSSQLEALKKDDNL
jgi:hypothetical protein